MIKAQKFLCFQLPSVPIKPPSVQFYWTPQKWCIFCFLSKFHLNKNVLFVLSSVLRCFFIRLLCKHYTECHEIKMKKKYCLPPY